MSAKFRARAIFERLKDIKNPVVAEIGVFTGALSAQLLKRPDLTLYMIDSWGTNHSQEYKDTNDFHTTLTAQQQENNYNRSNNVAIEFQPRGKMLRMDSVAAASEFEDGFFDLVFIDADHSYEGCKADIIAWSPKTKILSGHDYENNTQDFKFGVTEAVDEFFNPDLGENYTWFVDLSKTRDKVRP